MKRGEDGTEALSALSNAHTQATKKARNRERIQRNANLKGVNVWYRHCQSPMRTHLTANGKRRNAQMHKYTNAQMHKCSNAQMHKCTNAQMLTCLNAQMRKCSNAQMHKCSNAQMLKCSNAQMHTYSNTQMLK